MRSRSLAWFAPALLIVWRWLEPATSPGPQQRLSKRSEESRYRGRRQTSSFCARRRIALPTIAARHGLTSFDQLDEHAHDVFLVSGPGRFLHGVGGCRDADTPALQRLVEVVQGDPDVIHFEPNAIVVTPEVASGINLNGSRRRDPGCAHRPDPRPLLRRAGVDQLCQPAGHRRDSPRRRAMRRPGTGAGIVAIIDTGVDPNHPLLAGLAGRQATTSSTTSRATRRNGSTSMARWSRFSMGRLVAILDQHVARPAEWVDGRDPRSGYGERR